jgi:hypothetical protein
MAGQLLPPPDLAPALPPDLTREQCIELWLQLMDTCDLFLLAGLRRRVGPDGDLRAAYRAWHAAQREERDATMLHFMQEFQRRSSGHVR